MREIPQSAAKQIAEEFEKNQVIIVAWDDLHQIIHVTTYGTTRESSAQAAQGGNFVKEALGWPDRLCHDAPAWWLDNIERIGKLADKADNLLAAMKLPVSFQIHLEGLKGGLVDMSTELREIYQDVRGD